ncbi:MAG: cytochrome b5-like heme/steroid binding domain-containing protein [Candidatus Micrarchaeota archaeon]
MKHLILPLMLSLLLFGCTSNTDNQAASAPPAITPTNEIQTTTTQITTTVPTSAPSPSSEVKTYTLADISQHSIKGDCWLAIYGKVYDVSEYTKHPGGDAILEGCGKDATELFETRPMGSGMAHSEEAQSMLPNYYIGELAA